MDREERRLLFKKRQPVLQVLSQYLMERFTSNPVVLETVVTEIYSRLWIGSKEYQSSLKDYESHFDSIMSRPEHIDDYLTMLASNALFKQTIELEFQAAITTNELEDVKKVFEKTSRFFETTHRSIEASHQVVDQNNEDSNQTVRLLDEGGENVGMPRQVNLNRPKYNKSKKAVAILVVSISSLACWYGFGNLNRESAADLHSRTVQNLRSNVATSQIQPGSEIINGTDSPLFISSNASKDFPSIAHKTEKEKSTQKLLILDYKDTKRFYPKVLCSFNTVTLVVIGPINMTEIITLMPDCADNLKSLSFEGTVSKKVVIYILKIFTGIESLFFDRVDCEEMEFFHLQYHQEEAILLPRLRVFIIQNQYECVEFYNFLLNYVSTPNLDLMKLHHVIITKSNQHEIHKLVLKNPQLKMFYVNGSFCDNCSSFNEYKDWSRKIRIIEEILF